MTALDLDVHVRGVRLRYRDWGGHGTPVVLLHGLASNSHIWDGVAPCLVPNMRVLALDQRGHGASEKPEDGYDFVSVVADLEAFLVAVGIPRAVIVGHSWGGNVALQFGATVPAAALGLVFVDGGFLDLKGDGAAWEQVETELAPPDLTNLTLAQLLEQGKRWNAETGWTPAVEATLRASFRTVDDGTIRPQLSRENHLRILRALWEQDPVSLYPLVRCPVLLVPAYRGGDRPGGYQQRKRAWVAAAAAGLERSQVHAMEDTIHDVPLHRPAALAETIAGFAREVAAAST
jgi:pimeloyl-ACP methyl ester carboxylesterase